MSTTFQQPTFTAQLQDQSTNKQLQVTCTSHLPQQQGGIMYLEVIGGSYDGHRFYRVSVNGTYPSLTNSNLFLTSLLKNF